jgi:hypothetical protein
VFSLAIGRAPFYHRSVVRAAVASAVAVAHLGAPGMAKKESPAGAGQGWGASHRGGRHQLVSGIGTRFKSIVKKEKARPKPRREWSYSVKSAFMPSGGFHCRRCQVSPVLRRRRLMVTRARRPIPAPTIRRLVAARPYPVRPAPMCSISPTPAMARHAAARGALACNRLR